MVGENEGICFTFLISVFGLFIFLIVTTWKDIRVWKDFPHCLKYMLIV